MLVQAAQGTREVELGAVERLATRARTDALQHVGGRVGAREDGRHAGGRRVKVSNELTAGFAKLTEKARAPATLEEVVGGLVGEQAHAGRRYLFGRPP